MLVIGIPPILPKDLQPTAIPLVPSDEADAPPVVTSPTLLHPHTPLALAHAFEVMNGAPNRIHVQAADGAHDESSAHDATIVVVGGGYWLMNLH